MQNEVIDWFVSTDEKPVYKFAQFDIKNQNYKRIFINQRTSVNTLVVL